MTVTETSNERAIRPFGYHNGWPVPRTRPLKDRTAKIADAEDTGGTITNLSDRVDDTGLHRAMFGLTRKDLRTLYPFLTVVVTVAKEIISNEASKLRPRRT